MKIKTAMIACVMCGSVMAKPPADVQARLDAFARTHPGGVAVAWVDADGPRFFTSGQFSTADARPITADTEFEIGSVTKAFTSMLLAESVRAGKVALDDPAAKYLLPAGDADQAALAKITLRSLATHSSGLPRLPYNIGPNPDANPDPYAKYDRAMLVLALRKHGPNAPVGRSVAYSNLGGALLGEALAAAWGTSYADALQAHVLDPLGMKHTGLNLAGVPLPAEFAPGHAGGEEVSNWHQLAFAPAGGLHSTARDLAIFLQAALGNQQAPLQAAFADTTKSQRKVEDLGGEIGLNWLLIGDADHRVVWHNGGTGGYRSFVGFSRSLGLGVAVLTNTSESVDALGFGLMGVKPSRPEIAAVKDAAGYVGRYPLAPGIAMDITEVGGHLYERVTGQMRLPLRGTAPDSFAVVGVPAEISFERDHDGKVIALVLHQNGQTPHGVREQIPLVKTLTLPPEVLAEYAGKYALAPTFALTITVEGSSVFAQATGQGKAEVYASAKDEFFYTIVEARLSFTRDAAGKVAGLVLHQNGRDIPGEKAE